MADVFEIVNRWTLLFSDNDKQIFMNSISQIDTILSDMYLDHYVEFVYSYAKDLRIDTNTMRENDCLASGIIFFYGCLLYIMHFPDWHNYIESIYWYNILYLLVDHYIDDNSIDEEVKKIAITQMSIIIKNPSLVTTINVVDPILLTIANVYQKLITKHPATKKSIIQLFQAEIEGLDIQNNPACTEKEYYDIATKKGGYTMLVLYDIVSNTNEDLKNASYHIGTIMQLIDDGIDVLADKNKNINTIATYYLNDKKNLDDLWFHLIRLIDDIHPYFMSYKAVYMFFAVYIPDRLAECYSKQLRAQTTTRNIFDYNYGCDASKILSSNIMNAYLTYDIIERTNS